MKKRTVILIVLLLSFASLARSPIPGTNVHDFAGILGNYSALDRRIEMFYQRTGVEMAVVTVPDLDNQSLEMYAARLFEKWGIGKKGEDKGLLLLIALETREMRLEVGYGLEGALPDSFVGVNLQNLVGSALASGEISGIVDFVDVLEKRIIAQGDEAEIPGNQRTDLAPYEGSGRENPYGGLILFAIIIVLILLDLRFTGGLILASLLRGRGPRGPGGSSGGRGRYGGGGRSGGGGASGKW